MKGRILNPMGKEALRMTKLDYKKFVANTNPECDPDFGNVHPEDSDIYMIVITPTATTEKMVATGLGWHFLMILPPMQTEAETQELVSNVLGCFLEIGDHYYARPYKEEDFKKYSKSMPIISYDPEKMFSEGMQYEYEDLFFWLKPPLGSMH